MSRRRKSFGQRPATRVKRAARWDNPRPPRLPDIGAAVFGALGDDGRSWCRSGIPAWDRPRLAVQVPDVVPGRCDTSEWWRVMRPMMWEACSYPLSLRLGDISDGTWCAYDLAAWEYAWSRARTYTVGA